MVMEVVEEDEGEGSSMQMQYCIKHPLKNTRRQQQGGICAFCLEEKLGKLVSSSFPVAIFPSSSTSSSPSSFRSNRSNNNNKKKKKMAAAATSSSNLKRSKSSGLMEEDYIPHPQRKAGFWSFLYFNHHHHPSNTSRISKKREEEIRPHKVDMSVLGMKGSGVNVDLIQLPIPIIRERKSNGRPELQLVVAGKEEDEERRVSRSRSVGCGSTSGDFLERIVSTGFGDCTTTTLRRVESQREAKSRIHHSNSNSNANNNKDQLRCRGIFSGFLITSSSSSSSSSSRIEQNFNVMKTTSCTPSTHHHQHQKQHARSKSWGYRAFSGKRDSSSSISNNATTSTPNLPAIPSLLGVRG